MNFAWEQNSNKGDPEKLRKEREELELKKKKGCLYYKVTWSLLRVTSFYVLLTEKNFYFVLAERARLQAEAEAAEDARRQAEAEAAAEAAAESKRQREVEREAARQALLKVTLHSKPLCITGSQTLWEESLKCSTTCFDFGADGENCGDQRELAVPGGPRDAEIECAGAVT